MPAMDYSQVAALYDLYVDTEIDVPFFLKEAGGCTKVLELTSGTGRLSLPLIEAGVPLSCLDSTPEMLAVLRRKLEARGLSAPTYEMDMTRFSIPEKFDLVLIPFNAFAEISQPEQQQKALAAMRAHLSEGGRLICTLHNPAVRLKNVNGEIHFRGRFALPDGGGTLFLSSLESYDPASRLVTGAQIYEFYSPEGVLASKRFLDLKFFLHTRQTFEDLARQAAFSTAALYGDYDRSDYRPQTSPFMIFILRR